MSKTELDPKTRFPLDLDKKRQIQEIIDLLRSHYHEIQRNGILKHPSQIIDAYKGEYVPGLLFLSTFDEFVKHQETEVAGGNLKKGTLKNYYTTQRYLHSFVKQEFKKKEIPMTMFDRRFLDKFFSWLVDNTTSSNNGRSKHFERIKRFTTVIMNYGHIDRSPFLGFKINTVVNPRTYLTEEEVCAIRDLDILSESFTITRDMFLLMCNTGLAYSDLLHLNESQIEKTMNGMVIKGNRQKTNSSFMIPLTQEAEQIIEKYSYHPIAEKKNRLLPIFCNQVFNRHLKVIGNIVGLDKKLSSHVARHTFATIALTSGVPQVTIQKVLGHADLRMTQHYSRLIDKKLVDDMEAFKTFMQAQKTDSKQNDSEEHKTPSYKMRVV